jgi:hypothetical protein
MTFGSPDPRAGRDDPPTGALESASPAPPPETLIGGTAGDRCLSCSAPLSSDQRYCVVCGERRGTPRFSLAATEPAEPPAPAVVTRPTGGGGGRFSSGTTLVAGVATLLLAMLVGVLIGHNTAGSGTRTVASAPVRIITTGGGAGAASTVPSSSASGSVTTPTTKHPSSKKSSTAKPKAKAVTAKAAKKTSAAESGAASKVLGNKSTPPATVTVGATGTGKGYSKKTHKFTGSFFGQ